MELEQFITRTLIDVVSAVKRANEATGGGQKFQLRAGEEISFDIAITVTEGTKTAKEGGIKVYALKLGGEKSDSNSNENISRIKFKIKPNSNLG